MRDSAIFKLHDDAAAFMRGCTIGGGPLRNAEQSGQARGLFRAVE